MHRSIIIIIIIVFHRHLDRSLVFRAMGHAAACGDTIKSIATTPYTILPTSCISFFLSCSNSELFFLFVPLRLSIYISMFPFNNLATNFLFFVIMKNPTIVTEYIPNKSLKSKFLFVCLFALANSLYLRLHCGL